MLRNINIDTILRDHYSSIYSEKLSEDKIDIDDTLEIENSSTKYLQLFACFLNEAYYRGYVISNSIMKKLMDIIEYEGFEYQILEKYIDIIFDNINDYKCDEDNRPVYREFILEPEESKNFIMEYLQAIHDDKAIYSSKDIPHFTNPNSAAEQKSFNLKLLTETEYPIDKMYKTISNNDFSNYPMLYAEEMEVIFNENINAYKALLKNNKSPFGLVFLLDYDNNRALDILVNKITSLPQLASMIRSYEYYISQIIDDEDRTKYRFSSTVNDNIRRLIELLTINVTIEQTAMIIGTDYNLWRTYCDENYHELDTLLFAVNLYQSDPDRFKILNPVEYIFKIRDAYPDDVYFYARNTLLSMNYKLFCNNFIDIFKELSGNLNDEELKDLFNECFDGLIALRNRAVDIELIKLNNKICSIYTTLKNSNKNTIVNYNGKELITDFINIDIDTIDNIMKLFNIEYKLLNRNGKFDPALLPNPNSDMMVDYKNFKLDKSVSENVIYMSNSKPTIGSYITDTKTVQSMDANVKLEFKYFDNSFRLSNRDNASYIAIYTKVSKPTNIDLLVVHGENNNKLKLSNTLPEKGNYLLGLITSSNLFIYGGILLEDENSSMVNKLYDYYEQNLYSIDATKESIIEAARIDTDVYYSDDNDNKYYANYKVILSEDYDYNDGTRSIVLL